jgi:signal transduction histidine kinase/CheY-like chemotaxis protein
VRVPGRQDPPNPDFRSIFESVPAACLVLDVDFDIVAVNDDYLAATLTERDAIVGRHLFAVFPDNPDDPDTPGTSNLRMSLERVRRDLVTDVMPVQKYDIPLPDGTGFEERFWSPINVPVVDVDGALAYIVHHVKDVTDAVRMEVGSAGHAESRGDVVAQTRLAAAASRELKEANAELSRRAVELALAHERADKANVAKSAFLSRMSHELRTPLNAILGFAQLLEMDDLSVDQQAALSHIIVAGGHLVDLVNDILDLERVEAGRLPISMEPVNLQSAVDTVVELAEPIAERRGSELTVVAGATETWVMADVRRLTQVLLNLVANAIKYGPRGGQATIAVVEHDHVATVRVSDTGAGIAPEDLVRVFEPFERLSAEQTDVEGAGLGLSLARSLCDAMGGSIEVESTVGKGSSFTVVLRKAERPRMEGIDPAATAGSSPADALDSRHSGVVLYIEDNPANIALMRHVFARTDAWELLHAGTLAEAHACLAHTTPDLVLLDLHLPDGSGEALLESMREDDATSRVPIVVLTADAMPGTRRRLRQAGADAFVTKPFDVGPLVQAIDHFLAEGRD